MTRKKDGGRESGDRAVSQAGRPKLSTADVERTSSAAANPAARIRELEAETAARGRHQYCRDIELDQAARIRELEALSEDLRIEVLAEVARAEKAEARIALMEQATCDLCGHKFYALETGE